MTESLHARCDSTYHNIIHFGVNQMSNTNRNRKETAEEVDGGKTSDLAAAIPDSFGVTDASQANWLVRKIKELRAYKTRVKHWAATEL
jgi:hypothetical protein